MSEITLKNIGAALRRERGDMGLRETAKEIGISPATLSRVEGGKFPDIDTFRKICQWMELDAGKVLGTKIDDSVIVSAPMVHLKAEKNLSEKAVKALSSMIIAANACFTD
jgi:transcriptional regulator with XRE-family HTH domain